MKHFLIFSIFLMAFFSTKADSGNAYLFKVEVKHAKGIFKGYFHIADYIYIDSADEARYLNSEKEFTKFFRSIYGRDSLELFRSIYTIDSLYLHIYLKDQRVALATAAIQSIKLKKISDGFLGVEVTEGRFTSKDLIWLKKPYLYKEDYKSFGCYYTLYFFEKVKKDTAFEAKKKKYTQGEFWDLTDEEMQEWESLLLDYLKSLQNQKVMIRAECGC